MNRYSERIKISAVLLIGSMLSIWLFQYMNDKSRDELERNFTSHAKEHLFFVRKNIETEIVSLKSVVGLFEASDNVNRKEFTSFVKRLFEGRRGKSFQALEWIPQVSLDERDKFQTRAKKNGFAEYEIKERNKNADLIKAKQREVYFPVYFVEPYEGNELALGFDLASNPIRKKALEKARDTGKVVTSGKINLVQLKEDSTGVLMFHPIYHKNKPLDSIELRQKYLKGFVLGVVKVKSLISDVIHSSNGHGQKELGIDYYIYDRTSSEEEALFINYADDKKTDGYKLSLHDARKGYHFESIINIGDRQWNVIARPNKENFNSKVFPQNSIMFLSSLLLVFFLSAYIYALSNRAYSVKKLNEAEQASILSETRLNEAQHLAKVGSWELNLESGALIWSNEIFNIFEIDKSMFEASYEAFLNAIHPDDRDMVNQAYTESLEHREPYEIVHRLKMNNGKIKYVRETCKSYFVEDKPIRSVGTVQDITEIYLAELELTEYREHLEDLIEERTKTLKDTQDELVRKERLATLGQLTATVSHELRNPLAAMRPSLYVLQKKCDKKDEYINNALGRIDRSIERCDCIIDELLDFTRITELHKEIIQIDEWLESVVDEQIIPKEIKVEKNFTLKDIALNVDAERLRRVIINVFENASHSMMDDSQKIIKDKNAKISIATLKNDNRFEINISDSGCGIPEEILAKVFEPLFSTKGFGVGLGMPTVKKIMQQHAGGIEIESEEGKGTKVILWLPVK